MKALFKNHGTHQSRFFSRFNKQMAVRDKHLLETGFIDGDGEYLLMMRRDPESFALVTSMIIKGSWRGAVAEAPHSTGELSY